jgi:hypothetical protein
MNLSVWDLAADPYDHSELAGNWSNVDSHNHTAGKGVQIPSAGIADGSITTAKLADNSVTGAKIVDGTITGADIASATITADKLDSAIDTTRLGVVVAWFRPSLSFAVPSKYHICDGSTLIESTDHDWTGAGNVTIPDLRNKMILGAATSGTGTGTGTPPAENATGGSMSTSLAHAHTVASHSHTVNSHAHSIGADGVHYHYYGADGGTLAPPTAPTGPTQESTANRGNNNYQTAAPGVPEAFAYQAHTHYGNTSQDPGHSHGGTTGSSTASTTASSPATDSQLSTLDKRPSFVGLLYIIKVRN